MHGLPVGARYTGQQISESGWFVYPHRAGPSIRNRNRHCITLEQNENGHQEKNQCQKFWTDITREKVAHLPQQKTPVSKACQACGWISRSRRTQKSSEVADFFYSMLMCRVRAVAWIGPTQAYWPPVQVCAEEVAGEGVASRHHWQCTGRTRSNWTLSISWSCQ